MIKHLTILSLLMLAAPARTQDTPAEPAPFALAAGELVLTDFVDACANYLGWNILYEKQQLAGAPPSPTKLQRPVVTDRDGCEELLYELLHRRGFAVKSVDLARDIYEVIQRNGPRARELADGARYVQWQAVLDRPTLKRTVITALPLKHLNAQTAQNSLRPFFAGAGAGGQGLQVGTVGSKQSLLLQGLQDQVAQAVRMIQHADVPEKDGTPRSSSRTLNGRLRALEDRIKALEEKIAALSKSLK